MKALKLLGMALIVCSVLFVSCKKDKQYTITVKANDTTMGTVTGGGVFDANATTTLTATPNDGYRFVQWSDGAKTNPYTISVTENKEYTAYFEALPNGVHVTFGSAQWTATSFELDATSQTLVDNHVVLAQIEQNSYPMAQIKMPNFASSISTPSSQHYLIYMENANDASGQTPNWQTNTLTTTINTIDLNAHTITATQNGTLKNNNTEETREIKVLYKNATWVATIFDVTTKLTSVE